MTPEERRREEAEESRRLKVISQTIVKHKTRPRKPTTFDFLLHFFDHEKVCAFFDRFVCLISPASTHRITLTSFSEYFALAFQVFPAAALFLSWVIRKPVLRPSDLDSVV